MTPPKPSRREFLKTSTGVVAGASVAASAVAVKASEAPMAALHVEPTGLPAVTIPRSELGEFLVVNAGPLGWQVGDWLTIDSADEVVPVRTASDIVYARAMRSAKPGELTEVLALYYPFNKIDVINGDMAKCQQMATEYQTRFRKAIDA